MSEPTFDSRSLASPDGRELICDALQDAELAVAAFYAIRPREWSHRFRYDIASASEHPHLPFRAGTLAQIVGLEIEDSPRPPRWRIVLRDPAILRLGRRWGVRTVLAYTLAHELVHLVRFASGLAPFDATEEHARSAEEARVCRIAREALLRRLGDEARPALDALAGACSGPGTA